MKDKKNIKICVALSGGVDSSVAALLLKQAGFDVFAMFMQNWHDADSTLHGACEWEEDREVAELVARKIGVPFHFIDLSEVYRKRVVDYMFSEYEAGRTPNPDVLCNSEIKFDAFLSAARKLGADFVATGHYCRKGLVGKDGTMTVPKWDEMPQMPDAQILENRLLAGSDPRKDQSYFLCQITQEQLSRAVFPIGDLLKTQVRDLARRYDLPSAEKKDSQGICFVGKVDLPVFLRQKLIPKKGEVIEVFDQFYKENPHYQASAAILASLLKDGAEIDPLTDYVSDDKYIRGQAGNPALEGGCVAEGSFDREKLAGLTQEQLLAFSAPISYEEISFEKENYRSGRRRKLKTRYKYNPRGQVIGEHEGAQFYTIGQRKGLGIGGRKESLFVIATDTTRNLIYVGEGHRHRGLSRFALRISGSESWLRKGLVLAEGQTRRYRVRIRYRQPLQDATLIRKGAQLFIIFDAPQRGITPGQFAAWYDGDELVGSGQIA